jgi:Na+-translocating ferredoxin:NAD+ oxidoreductase subunit C
MPVRSAAQAEAVQIVDLHNDYPQSDPTLMLYTVASRRLRPGQLPVTQKVLLLDAAAALMVSQAASGSAALQTPLAVRDHVHRRIHFLSIAVGTPLRDILQRLHIPADQVMIRGGDLLRDVRLRPDAVVGGAELVIHITPPELDRNPEPCIRCGWCLQTCPTRVQPAALLDAAQRDDRRMADRAGLHACLECGLCSHVCPSRLPLAEAIRKLRSER